MTADIRRQAHEEKRTAEWESWLMDEYPVDLGEGVRLRWSQNGDITLYHRRPDNNLACGVWVQLVAKHATHEIVEGDVDKPTISPNITCGQCGHSGFIREGRWVPL